MVDLTSDMKSYALSFNSMLKADTSTIDSIQDRQEENIQKLDKTDKKFDKMNQNYEIGFWRLLIMLVVALVLTWITVSFILVETYLSVVWGVAMWPVKSAMWVFRAGI